MRYKVHNTADYLLIEDTSNQNINYYSKDKLSVSASSGNVVITNDGVSIFSYPPADIDLPVFNGLYDLVTTIHSYIYSTSQGDIRQVQKTLTSAEILAMNSTPITLVNGISGSEIQVVSAAMHLKWGGVAYATNTTLAIGTTSDPDGQAELNCLAATSDIKGTFGLLTAGTSANMHTGENLVASVASGNPVNGNSQVVVDVLYRVTDMP